MTRSQRRFDDPLWHDEQTALDEHTDRGDMDKPEQDYVWHIEVGGTEYIRAHDDEAKMWEAVDADVSIVTWEDSDD